MNYCLINPNGDFVKVILKADNGIRASGYFYLIKLENNEYQLSETHEVRTGDNGRDSFTLTTLSNLLKGQILVWHVNSCAQIAQGIRGKVRVEIFQNEKKLKTTSKVLHTGNFPPCDGSEGDPRKLKNQLVFSEMPPMQNIKLWKELDL